MSCRVCLEDIDISNNDKSSFFSPCLCSGTQGLIHKTCYKQMIEIEHSCQVCLLDYPMMTNVLKPPHSPGSSQYYIHLASNVLIKLNEILSHVGGYQEIRKIHGLLNDNTSLFETILNHHFKTDNIKLYGVQNSATIDYLNSGGVLLPNNNTDNDLDEYQFTTILENPSLDGLNNMVNEMEESEDTPENLICHDILISLTTIKLGLYNPDNQEPFLMHDINQPMTLKYFRQCLGRYYLDLVDLGLQSVEKNPCLGKAVIYNFAYHIGTFVSLFKISRNSLRINTATGILMIMSSKWISKSQKDKFRQYILKTISKNKVDNSSYLYSTIKTLDNNQFKRISYPIQAVNYGIIGSGIYLIYRCSRFGISFFY